MGAGVSFFSWAAVLTGRNMCDDNNPASKFTPGKKFDNWKIVKKLDEGGFGQVYVVENWKKPGEYAALKAEPTEVEGGSAIKLEIAALRRLNEGGNKPHVPQLLHAAKHKKYCYMIMTLLGDNLKNLKLGCPGELMPVKTWVRIAIQCLYSLKYLHDYGYVHRDIKPNNFVLGNKDDALRSRIVHILDFGLSRPYAFKSKDGKEWIARKARGSAEFRGTLRYCSPSVHEKMEQGRKDDIWSLFYVLIELHCGLPWQTVRDKEKIVTQKMHMADEELVLKFPSELHAVIPHLRSLDCYQRPDYGMIHQKFLDLMKRLNVSSNDPYEWEKDHPEILKNALKAQKTPPAWENAVDFFKSDPIKIDKAPTAEQEANCADYMPSNLSNSRTEKKD